MKRGTGLSLSLKVSGESRGRAPGGERVFQKGRAPRRANQSGAPLARDRGIYLRAFRRSASLFGEARS